MRHVGQTLSNTDNDRPMTVAEMVRRWGADASAVILSVIASSGNYHFDVIEERGLRSYVLILEYTIA